MKYTYLVFMLLFVCSCNEIPDGCSDFKTGYFTYRDKDHSDVIVERNDSIQIERGSDYVLKCRIRWLSECKYILDFIDVSNRPNDPRIGKTLEVDIVRIEDNEYRYHAYAGSYSGYGWMIKND